MAIKIEHDVDGTMLPFPQPHSVGVVGRTMQEWVCSPQPVERRLPDDAANILIMPIDDAGPRRVVLDVDDTVVLDGPVPVSAPVAFTANDCLGIGRDLGFPVALDDRDKAPFAFDGTIHQVDVDYAGAV